ncbi:MAG: 4Fe-4S binding protein [Methanobacteriota archaeon]|nr:MAG: 4Fe-4S binding protein [Euryarchaeota archaeon]
MKEEEQVGKDRPTVAVYLCRCDGEISQHVDLEEVAERISLLPDVRVAGVHDTLCSDDGRKFMKENRGKDNSDRVIIGACSPEILDSPLTHDLIEVGVNKYLVNQVDLREQCAWVHSDKERATSKAAALTRGAIQKALKQEPLEDMIFPVIGAALIVGAREPGQAAAKRIASSGFKAYIVDDANAAVDYDVSQGTTIAGPAEGTHPPSLSDSRLEEDVTLFLRSAIETMEGGVGKWTVRVRTPEGMKCLDVGTIIMTVQPLSRASDEKKEPATAAPTDYTRRILHMLHVGRGEDMTIRRLTKRHLPDLNRGIFVLESSMGLEGAVPAIEDAISAADVSIAIMRKGTMSIPRIIARVEEYRCRGCGKCAEVCEYDAVSLVERDGGIRVAHIDASRCEGCGLCRVACCNGSMALLGYTITQLLANMMGIAEEMSV